MDGQPTVVVTGGGRGIGLAVVQALSEQGCRVVSTVRGRAVGTESVVGDLSTVDGVRAVAAAIRARCGSLDALVHNAGVWPTRLVRTEDGFEESYAVNHIAPFLLNHLLEDLLLESGTRVVQVSAGLYVKGKVDVERTPTGLDFHRVRTYCDTKLANLMMVPLFAERWRGTGASITAVHPGVIRTGLGDPGGALGLLLRLVKRRWGTPEEGAEPVVERVLADAGAVYYDRHQPTPLTGPALDTGAAAAVWRHAEDVLHREHKDVP